MIGPTDIVRETEIGDQVFAANQPRPASEHLIANYRDYNPSILSAVAIGRRRPEARISRLPALKAEHVLLRQQSLGEGHASSQERCFNQLSFTCLRAVVKRNHDTKGGMERGAVVLKGNNVADWRTRKSGETHGPGHGLRDG